MTIIAILDEAGFISHTQDFLGPVEQAEPGTALMADRVIFSQAPTPTHRARPLPDGRIEWVETGTLDAHKAAAIAKTYPDVDAVYDAAIGRRATEYANAEAAAREYLATEVRPSAVSGYITGHARSNPTGQQQTNEWAAHQIIERADAFRWAELQMRNVRFDRQADMRAATAPDELAAAVREWDGFITWLRSTLGLQSTG